MKTMRIAFFYAQKYFALGDECENGKIDYVEAHITKGLGVHFSNLVQCQVKNEDEILFPFNHSMGHKKEEIFLRR
jgi:hypothetical protein